MLEVLTPRTYSYTHDHANSHSSSPTSSSPTLALAASTMSIAASTSGLNLNHPHISTTEPEPRPGHLSPTSSISPRNSLAPPTITTIPPPDSTSLSTLLSLAAQPQSQSHGRNNSITSISSSTSGAADPDLLLSTLLPATQTILHYRPARASDLPGIAAVRQRSAGLIFSTRENSRSKADLQKRNRAAVDAAYHDPHTVMLVAEIAGLKPGSSRRGSVVSRDGTWDSSVEGSAAEQEAKPKPPRREVVGVLELKWEGGTSTTTKKHSRPRSHSHSHPHIGPLIEKAKALATRSSSRKNSVVKMAPEIPVGADVFSDQRWTIETLVVSPLHQGKGVGSSLLGLALEACEGRGEAVGMVVRLGTQEWFGRRGMGVLEEVESEGRDWVAMIRRPGGGVGSGFAELEA